MTRYHPLLVTLHWLLALLLMALLIMGSQVLAELPNSDPGKIDALRSHMMGGIAVGVLMLIRLITRLKTTHPPKADTGHALLNRAGHAAHWGLYLLVFAIVASGMGISMGAGLPEIVFFGAETPLPENFFDLPPRKAHGILTKLLGALILAHIAGWAVHQFVIKDGLISRMWYGKR